MKKIFYLLIAFTFIYSCETPSNEKQDKAQIQEKEYINYAEYVLEHDLYILEDLEEDYNYFLAELNTNGNQTRLISAMIKNYQKRLEILQNVLDQIQQIKNPQILNDEIFI